MNNENQFIDKIRPTSFWIGVFLIVFGAFTLLSLVVVVIKIVTEPEDAVLVQWVISRVSENDLVLSGHINEATFEIRSSSELMYILLGLIGLVLVSILSTVVSTLISGGIKLIKFSGTSMNRNIEESQSNKAN